MKKIKILEIALRGIAAIIMLQTLYFKFTAADESVYIFTKMGIEPWGRIGTGILELFASILLITPSLKWMGAMLGAGMMTGAIISHITVIGLDVMNDHGYLFFLALTVWSCCIVLIIFERKKVPVLKKLFV